MAKVRVAVFGARNIGKFHVRELTHAGAEVTCILGKSNASASETAADIRAEFGIRVKPYSELDTLLEEERIDAVSICTPTHLHYVHAKKCLTAGLHVLCEKPFVLESFTSNSAKTRELVELSKKNGVVLTVNTQWPSVIETMKKHIDLAKLESFSMYTQPALSGGAMLADHLSHANSMLVKLIPHGHAEGITFIRNSDTDIEVRFRYLHVQAACDVAFRFVQKLERPREVRFSFNGLEFKREIGSNYQQRLVSDVAAFDIEDPFRVSIRRFVGAIQGKTSPLISDNEILESVALQDTIMSEYQLLDKGKNT